MMEGGLHQVNDSVEPNKHIGEIRDWAHCHESSSERGKLKVPYHAIP